MTTPEAESAAETVTDPQAEQSSEAAPHTGSLSRRMMIIAAGWILVLLFAGGLALDRALVDLVEDNFDDQLTHGPFREFTVPRPMACLISNTGFTIDLTTFLGVMSCIECIHCIPFLLFSGCGS